MKFKDPAHEEAYYRALRHPYKAAAFDLDGTLTEFGKFRIPDFMRGTLQSLPLELPLVLCTGRPIDFIERQMQQLCDTEDALAQRERWWVVAENGGSAYRYDKETKEYRAFYEVRWPSESVSMEEMKQELKAALGWHVHILIRSHTVVVVYPPWFYLSSRLLRMESLRNSRKITRFLKKKGWDEFFTSQNSGLGTLIFPKEGGKGRAIQSVARELGIPVKDVLCVGDSPQQGGNDEDFLSGDYGTPFTVGALCPSLHPFPVLNERGVRMKGPKGTQSLLKQVFRLAE